jgi:hypothetical protein
MSSLVCDDAAMNRKQLNLKLSSLIEEREATKAKLSDVSRKIEAIEIVLKMEEEDDYAQSNKSEVAALATGDPKVKDISEPPAEALVSVLPAQRGDVMSAVADIAKSIDGEFELKNVMEKLRSKYPAIDFKDASISGALSRLAERGKLTRIGEPGHGRKPSKYVKNFVPGVMHLTTF